MIIINLEISTVNLKTNLCLLNNVVTKSEDTWNAFDV
jgi:hypothetical protein